MVWDTNQIKGYGNSFVILNMSCFFGVFSPGGKIDRDAFEQMQKAIHREGYDELGIHIDDSIAMGHLMLRVTTESVYDKQPLKSSCGRYLLVGHFRLDYRDELADKLGLTQQELELIPDSLLVMLAFKKWNQKCVDYLEGDWSFVLFDSNNKELFLAKDILGFSALFYTKFNENIYFSSAPFILTSVTSVFKELNFAEIQNVLYHGTRSPEGHTFFENHFAVPAGTYLLINNTLELYTIKYSILLSNQKVNYKYDFDYQLDFQSIFSLAIYSRIQNIKKKAISLSSGRDSTAVFYFANKIMQYQEECISTYTWSSYNSKRIDDDRRLRVDESIRVKEFLLNFVGAQPQFIECNDDKYSKLFDSYKTFDFYNPFIHVNSIWVNKMFEESRKSNDGLILIAAAGNYSLTWNGPKVQNSFFVEARYKELFMHLFHVRKKIFSIASNYVLSLTKAFVFFKSKSSFRFKHNSDIFLKSYIFKTTKSKNKSVLSKARLLFSFESDIELRKEILNRHVSNIASAWYLDSQSYAQTVADPTCDIRFVNYCLSIPVECFNRNGDERYLYKRMMKGKMPDNIVFSNRVYPQAYNSGEKFILDKEIHTRVKGILKDKLLKNIFDFGYFKSSYVQLFKKLVTVQNVILVNKFLRELSIIEFVRKNITLQSEKLKLGK